MAPPEESHNFLTSGAARGGACPLSPSRRRSAVPLAASARLQDLPGREASFEIRVETERLLHLRDAFACAEASFCLLPIFARGSERRLRLRLGGRSTEVGGRGLPHGDLRILLLLRRVVSLRVTGASLPVRVVAYGVLSISCSCYCILFVAWGHGVGGRGLPHRDVIDLAYSSRLHQSHI